MKIYKNYWMRIFLLLIGIGSMNSLAAVTFSTWQDLCAGIDRYTVLKNSVKNADPVNRMNMLEEMTALLNEIERFQTAVPAQHNEDESLRKNNFTIKGLDLKRTVLKTMYAAYGAPAPVRALTDQRLVQDLLAVMPQDDAAAQEVPAPITIIPVQPLRMHRLLEGLRRIEAPAEFATRPVIEQYAVLAQGGDLARDGVHDGMTQQELEILLAQEASLSGNTCANHAVKNALYILSILRMHDEYAQATTQEERTHIQERFNDRANDIRALTPNARELLVFFGRAVQSLLRGEQRMLPEELAHLVGEPNIGHVMHVGQVRDINPADIVIIPQVPFIERLAELDASAINMQALEAINDFKASQDTLKAFIVTLQDPRVQEPMTHWVTLIARKKAGVASFIIADSNNELTREESMHEIIHWGLIGRLLDEPVIAQREQDQLAQVALRQQEADRLAQIAEERAQLERERRARLEAQQAERARQEAAQQEALRVAEMQAQLAQIEERRRAQEEQNAQAHLLIEQEIEENRLQEERMRHEHLARQEALERLEQEQRALQREAAERERQEQEEQAQAAHRAQLRQRGLELLRQEEERIAQEHARRMEETRRRVEAEQSLQMSCSACNQMNPFRSNVLLECGHTMCRECLQAVLSMVLSNRLTFGLSCPECSQGLSDEDIRAVSSSPVSDLERIRQIQFEEFQAQEEALAAIRQRPLDHAQLVHREHALMGDMGGGAAQPERTLVPQPVPVIEEPVIESNLQECGICGEDRHRSNFYQLTCCDRPHYCINCLQTQTNHGSRACPLHREIKISPNDVRNINNALVRINNQARRELDERTIASEAQANREREMRDQARALLAVRPLGGAAAAINPEPFILRSIRQVEEANLLACPICMDEKNQQELMGLNCAHVMCRDCIRHQFDLALREQNPGLFICPECSAPINTDEEILEITNSRTALSNFREIQVRIALANPNNIRHCPTPECLVSFFNDDPVARRYRCESCDQRYCTQCLTDHSMERTCAQAVEDRNRTSEEDRANDAWKAAHTKPCPRCNKAIEKDGGCQHMTCSRISGGCGYEFCWICLDPWRSPARRCAPYHCRTQAQPHFGGGH